MDLHEKTLRSSQVYSGKIVNVRVDDVLLPDGSESKREVVDHPGAVAIVPVTPEGNVLCVRQYRKPAEKVLLEIPAGKLEEGEEPEACARREMAEEVGYNAQTMELLTAFYTSPGFASEKIYLFLASDLSKAEEVSGPADEHLQMESLPLADVHRLIRDGTVEDGKTIVGLLMALHHYRRG